MFNFFDEHKWCRVLLTAISSPLLLNMIPIGEASIFHSPQQKVVAIIQLTALACLLSWQRKEVRDACVRALLIFPFLIALISLGAAGSHARQNRYDRDYEDWFDD